MALRRFKVLLTIFILALHFFSSFNLLAAGQDNVLNPTSPPLWHTQKNGPFGPRGVPNVSNSIKPPSYLGDGKPQQVPHVGPGSHCGPTTQINGTDLIKCPRPSNVGDDKSEQVPHVGPGSHCGPTTQINGTDLIKCPRHRVPSNKHVPKQEASTQDSIDSTPHFEPQSSP
ncbi:hypothetical protein M758_4G231400 [Ceratodon purpureus]|nr:hypothetical protein M758_4G231400 [Ceratodon purpureus]